ncbi:hypothetical protein Val02_34760 [Virgisporangium aliadipatigenens]|uniref:Uncharacterized protein n=1 Tax=Virgisporangium aliadipatigenens TaxID=741659 RepID=A0A8J3YMH6_9ACTN|nr:hypothetical protein [Virgisporangium aliadipatigenens]GIJ46590.1 hypothetical protein Val02_34760 [Virgisporangium aliadipatigenens]
MTDRHAELDTAFERVITAARDHLAAVRAADGRADDDEVWRAYVELNNASFEYDELLLDAFGEVTPWDVDPIDPDEADRQFGVGLGGVDGNEPEDPHEHVISVRQRRDYRIPSVTALLRLAETARRTTAQGGDEPITPVETVGEAVLELMQAGDVSLSALDIPELESLDGVVVVAEVGKPLDPEAFDDADGTGPFGLETGDRLVDRLDEHANIDLDDEEEVDQSVAPKA